MPAEPVRPRRKKAPAASGGKAAAAGGASAAAEEVAELQRRLTGDNGAEELNNLSRLYEIAESEDLQDVVLALQAIPRVLAHHRRLCRQNAEGGDSTAELLTWLRGHSDAYYSALSQLAVSKNPRAQACGIRLAMGALQDEAEEARLLGGARGAAAPLAPELRVQALLTEVLLADHWAEQACECLMGEFANRYVDIRHHTMHHLRACLEQMGKANASAPKARDAVASNAAEDEPAAKRRRRLLGPFAEAAMERGTSQEAIFVRALAFLREAQAPAPQQQASAEAADEGELLAPAPGGRAAKAIVKDYRKVFQNAWLQLLGLRVPMDQCKPLLQLVPALVIPHLSTPLMLADFYLNAFNSGNAETSVLSLSGLFLLLTRYGLGDPDTLTTSSGEYYSRLYGLLTLETLQLKQRTRFQRLLTASLLSNLLPARLAGAFAKKCMRLAVMVMAEHGTVLWLMALAYSLVQKHHTHCSSLLNRKEADDNAEDEKDMSKTDGFDVAASLQPDAIDQAARSSLWEVQLLRRHHVLAVSTLARLFTKPFFRPSSKKLDPEDFLDQTISKIYAQALRGGERQRERWQSKGQRCPVAFKIEESAVSTRLAGWAASLSTSQRKAGADV